MSSRQIGNYRILEYIGSGGFGSVFKAEDTSAPGRVVAIKELHRKHTRNTVIKQRFFQEAVAMARLDHPNLPRLYTFGEDNGSYYLVMELLSGRLLGDVIHERGRLQIDLAVRVMKQVLDAVGYAHRNGIIHRDLKPDNIMLLGEDGSLSVKVLDFGIARMVGGENLTLTGEGFGTPAYMSPERMAGGTAVDQRTDIYSAGMILFEMLTGKAPFQSLSADPSVYWAEMRRLHESEPLPSLASFGVPDELERVVLKATARRVEDRYSTAEEMLADLDNAGTRELTSSSLPALARLSITTAPPDAEVYVDDASRGSSDARSGRILIEKLAPGPHTVRVSKPGYNEYRISVLLEEGRQADLQVALAARATVAIPRVSENMEVDRETERIRSGDDLSTALLVVEGVPAGSTIFVGPMPVSHADEDGRATLRLDPGVHEIQVTSPGGLTSRKEVTVTTDDIASRMTVTLPPAEAPPALVTSPLAERPASRTGRRIASAVALALVAVAYFALREPRHEVIQIDVGAQAVPSAPAAPEADPARIPDSRSLDVLVAEEVRAAIEQAKIAAEEAKKEMAAARKEAGKRDAEAPVAPTPPGHPATPRAAQGGPKADACATILVTGPNGAPLSNMRVMLFEMPASEGPIYTSGQTDARGRWQYCGLTPGKRMKVLVTGRRALPSSREGVIAAGNNQVAVTMERRPDRVPPQFRPANPQQRSERRRPFYRNP